MRYALILTLLAFAGCEEDCDYGTRTGRCLLAEKQRETIVEIGSLESLVREQSYRLSSLQKQLDDNSAHPLAAYIVTTTTTSSTTTLPCCNNCSDSDVRRYYFGAYSHSR